MRNIIFICLVCIPFFSNAQLLKSPASFLDNSFGKEFTPHHRIQDYFEYLEQESSLVKLVSYGKSYENRPLFAAFISSPSNLDNLENIRANHLRTCGRLEGNYEDSLEKTIVWLSFGIHGNEAASSEAAIFTMYQIINGADPLFKEALEDMIIIIDPCLNPDGHERYVNWYSSVAVRPADQNYLSREHQEPWPRGRSNHYLFDLNRDWIWGTQVETRQRLALYQNWMPHIHGDFHEMGPSEPYYFAPAAKPYSKYITDFQRSIQDTIGKNIASHFDKNGWLYFTKEMFDLFYPGYGDTYPMLNGAIGMTYEVGGGSRAGRVLIKKDGETLTLMDRLHQQTTSALATLESVFHHQEAIRENYKDYFFTPKKVSGGYVIKWNSKWNSLRSFTELMDLHNIFYRTLSIKPLNIKGMNYSNGRIEHIKIEKNDLWIPNDQPQHRLLQSIITRQIPLNDSSTYDITAWSLPYAFGFDTWEISETPNFEEEIPDESEAISAYAWVIPWNGIGAVKGLSFLNNEGIVTRFAGEKIRIDGLEVFPGDIIISRFENKDFRQHLPKLLNELSEKYGTQFHKITSGYAESGPDIGSTRHKQFESPSIYIPVNNSVSTSSFGNIWHYFEEELQYPARIVRTEKISSAVFDDAEIIILSSGSYTDFDEDHLKEIIKWVKEGGRLIIMGRSNQVFADKEGYNISLKMNEEEKDEEMNDTRYGERKQKRIENAWPGAIVRVDIDDSHPFSRGIGSEYYSLKENKRAFKLLDTGWNVGVLNKDFIVSGFAGSEAIEKVENTLILGHQESGQGDIIYMIDNPLFRGFWKNGQFLFANLVFQPL